MVLVQHDAPDLSVCGAGIAYQGEAQARVFEVQLGGAGLGLFEGGCQHVIAWRSPPRLAPLPLQRCISLALPQPAAPANLSPAGNTSTWETQQSGQLPAEAPLYCDNSNHRM